MPEKIGVIGSGQIYSWMDFNIERKYSGGPSCMIGPRGQNLCKPVPIHPGV